MIGWIPVRAGEEFTESPKLKKRNGIAGDKVKNKEHNYCYKRAYSEEHAFSDCFSDFLQSAFAGAYDKCCCAVAASDTLVSHEVQWFINKYRLSCFFDALIYGLLL